MKIKLFITVLIMLLAVSLIPAQESGKFVDIKTAEMNIAFLETENVNHAGAVAENNEQKAFLENRISRSENRIKRINENLDYAKQKNVEVNKLGRETEDRKTKIKIEDYRDDIVSLIRLLKDETKVIDKQIKSDKEGIAQLEKDSARRKRLIEKNTAEIASIKTDINATESRISEISATLDSIKGQIDSFRNEISREQVPVN